MARKSESQTESVLASKARVRASDPRWTALWVAVWGAVAATSAQAAYVPQGINGAQVRQSSYIEPGVIGDKASWETDEYKKDWGLAAMKASSAYALGFHGQGVAVAVMDSGALLQKHPELAGSRFHAVSASGQYSTTGDRYQPIDGVNDIFGTGHYEAGESFTIDGNYIANRNDTHGTHVTGTVGANRDGSEFHGVAWGSNIYVGNTGGTDNNNYGPFQDYGYFLAGWSATAQALINANGAARGGVINNSWGTNLRVDEKSTSLTVNTTADTEYEYFLFKKKYGDNPTFVDAAYEAVKGTNVVQVFTTGNRKMDQPYYRALYPYFNPDAEQHWIAVAGLQQSKTPSKAGATEYEIIDSFNKAGNAKWWTVVAPGSGIYSSIVYDNHYEDTSAEHPLGSAGYAAYSGTSMAAPHVTGAMGVLMSRYAEMSAIQVRDVLFTTASHKNPDGSTLKDWTATEGEPDAKYGWGIPDLDKGMYGPGQFLGKFDYTLNGLDVWTNDISETALKAREKEDTQWMTDTNNGTKLDGDYVLGEGKNYAGYGDASINADDAKAWRAQYYAKRAAAIKYKQDNNLYVGSLVKRGEGTLVLTGKNTYTGGTVVEGGTLLGFINSFGTGNIVVNGGRFGIITAYNDTLTRKGEIKYVDSVLNREKRDAKVESQPKIIINAGGTLVVDADSNGGITLQNLELKDGATVSSGSTNTDTLKRAFNGEKVESKLTVTGGVTGKVVAGGDLAFFTTTITPTTSKAGEPTTITTTMTKRAGGMAAAASTDNGRAIAAAIESAGNSQAFADILGATQAQADTTFASIGNDVNFSTQNMALVNQLNVTRAIKDVAQGSAVANTANVGQNAKLWATGVASWGKHDAGGASAKVDTDFYMGLVGAQFNVSDSQSVGAYFGAGTSRNKADRAGKIDGDSISLGLYGQTAWSALEATYGLSYTTEDRTQLRSLTYMQTTGVNSTNYDANIFELFGEVAYKGFSNERFAIEPFLGYTFMRASADGFSETVGNYAFKTDMNTQNVHVTDLGLRGGLPFMWGTNPMTLKANVSWMHMMGDTESSALMQIADAGWARIGGEKLSNLANVGLGVEGHVGQHTTFGINYSGNFNGTVTAHGLGVNMQYAF